jgi:hypothetical protein
VEIEGLLLLVQAFGNGIDVRGTDDKPPVEIGIEPTGNIGFITEDDVFLVTHV